MPTLSRRALVAGTAVAAIGVAIPATLAATSGTGTPANKAVAAGSHRVVVPADSPQAIMTATFRTSKPEDLLLTVSLECTILQSLTTDNNNPTGTDLAHLSIWIQDENGKVVPISDTSAPPQDPANSGNGTVADDSVTFCDRAYSRTVTDGETPADGIDTLSDYINTKSSHAFTWVRLNAGSGVHTYTVYADLTASAAGAASNSSDAQIGNRTLVIEPTKLANNAAIQENGTSTSG
jgi:hypothetical protein